MKMYEPLPRDAVPGSSGGIAKVGAVDVSAGSAPRARAGRTKGGSSVARPGAWSEEAEDRRDERRLFRRFEEWIRDSGVEPGRRCGLGRRVAVVARGVGGRGERCAKGLDSHVNKEDAPRRRVSLYTPDRCLSDDGQAPRTLGGRLLASNPARDVKSAAISSTLSLQRDRSPPPGARRRRRPRTRPFKSSPPRQSSPPFRRRQAHRQPTNAVGIGLPEREGLGGGLGPGVDVVGCWLPRSRWGVPGFPLISDGRFPRPRHLGAGVGARRIYRGQGGRGGDEDRRGPSRFFFVLLCVRLFVLGPGSAHC